MIVQSMPYPAGGAGGATYDLYRLYMTLACTPGSHLALFEWEIYETLGGPNVALLATATASSDGFGWVPSRINDGDYGLGWHAATGAVPQWVQLDFTSVGPKGMYKSTITPRTGSENQAPADFEIQGWNGASWDVLHSETGLTAGFWGTSPPKNFVI